MLQEMLDKQNELQLRLGTDIRNMSEENVAKFIKEHVVYMNNEVAEMLEELPFFKPWKDYSGMSSADMLIAATKARKEWIDVLHFFMNISLALGFDADTLYYMYMDKNSANHKRQDDGYDHTQRHLDS